MNEPKNINKEKQDFNSLQRSSHYRLTWEIFQKIKSVKTTIVACSVCILLTYLLTSFVAYKYGLSLFNGDSIVGLRSQIEKLSISWSEQNDQNKHLALRYHKNNKERESGLRDQIEKLDNEIEDHKKEKFTLRVQLEKANDLSAKQAEALSAAKTKNLADKMLNEAYQTIAMNAVPLNLQQYLSLASDEQWIGYAQMAAERNAYNVVKTIASIPALMKIHKVAAIVNNYSRATELANFNKDKSSIK